MSTRPVESATISILNWKVMREAEAVKLSQFIPVKELIFFGVFVIEHLLL